ncbi:MAG: hypothetical protein Kow0062_23160 [Acidobacteriota bacterium]
MPVPGEQAGRPRLRRAVVRLARLAVLTARHYLAARRACRRAGRDPVRRREAALEQFRAYARACLALLGVRLEVDGEPPGGGFLLVSNHVSYLDILVLAATARPVFVAKSEIARWPVIGHLARLVGTLFVDRGRIRALPAMLDQLAGLAAAGHGIVLFPEGTTTDGRRILPFRPGLLEVAARTGRAVHAAALSYATPPGCPPAEEAVAWWADMTLVDHVWRLLALPEIEARVAFAAEPVAGDDRKELAERLRGAVLASWAVPGGSREGEGMDDLAVLVGRNVALLRDADRLIAGLEPDAYAAPAPGAGDADHGVGSQLRHVLEFYGCLLAQWPEGSIDYDARPRERALETDPGAARARIARLVEGLDALAPVIARTPLTVRQDAGPDDAGPSVQSTLGRELAFLASHTIHHLALVAVLLRARGITVPDDFGVAPSTLAHRASRDRCAR